MGAFGVIIGILHYAGVYIQFNTAFKTVGFGEVDNYLSGNALFTEVPRDVVTRSGEDVEMACSFRGAGAPSYSLEIQWWYTKKHGHWRDDQPAQGANQVMPLEETSKEATKISVVKVAGSNISHKLRLSSVKQSDEGTYECRVIDFSGAAPERHHVHAYLHVEAPNGRGPGPDGGPPQRSGRQGPGSPPPHQHHHHHHPPGHQAAGRDPKRSLRSAAGCSENCAL